MTVIVIQFSYGIYFCTQLNKFKDSNFHHWTLSLTIGYLAIELVYLLQWFRIGQQGYVAATLI